MRVGLDVVAGRCNLLRIVALFALLNFQQPIFKNMSNLFTQADLETKYGINRSTVGRWVKANKLAADSEGFIDENDFLLVFRKSSSWKKLKEKATPEFIQKITGSLPLNEPNQLTGDLGSIPNMAYTPQKASGVGGVEVVTHDEDDLTGANLESLSKSALDRLSIVETVKERRRKNGLADGTIIKRSVVRRFVGRMGEIDSNQWPGMSGRLIDQVMGICEINDNAKKLALRECIDDEIYSVLANVQNLQLEFMEQINNESHG